MGFVCVDAGGTRVCAPASSLLGEPCAGDSQCASGTCLAVEEGGAQVCTSYCGPDVACAPGFECARLDGMGTNVCREVTVGEEDGGDCAVSPDRSGSAATGWALALVGLALLWRRRR